MFRRTVMSPQRRMRLLSFRIETTTGVAQEVTLTFPAMADADPSDFAVFYDATGTPWAVALDTTGSDVEPTADAWTAIAAGNKVQADVSNETTAAEVAAVVETALNGLTGFTDAFTTDDTAADGTLTITNDEDGAADEPLVSSADGLSAGNITATVDAAGVTRDYSLTKGKFDAVLTSASPGVYTLTFVEPYERAPEVGALAITDNAICKVAACTNLAVTIATENLSGNALEAELNLIVCGSDTEDFI